MKVLGSYLRDKRKSLNLTIQDMADKLNLAYSTVANMETGGKNPTLAQLKAYGLIFGCEWTELLHEVANEFNLIEFQKNHVERNYTPERAKELEIFNGFSSEFEEFTSYFDAIKKEYDEERKNEDSKIKNDIDTAICTILSRYITKDTPAINEREVPNLRDEIIALITMRVQHLTSR
jgi:transcriptional regulator with XRE-family HTH domain